MKRIDIYEYAQLLSGYSLQYFMVDLMQRDIDMECPCINKKDSEGDEIVPEWDDYIEEVIDWVIQSDSVSDSLMKIIRYSKEEDTDRFGRDR